MNLTAQLQINQTGAWRAIVEIDLDDLPLAFLEAADTLARAALPQERARRTVMRIVRLDVRQLGPDRFERCEIYKWTWQDGWRSCLP